MDLTELVVPVEAIIRQAASLMMRHFLTPLEKFNKPDQGFATQADLVSEEYIKTKLQELLPEASLLAEESGLTQRTTDLEWVIDPLDGTTNFAAGLPYFCISIALTKQAETIFAMIYAPLANELFFATKGNGAFLKKNQQVQKLVVSSTQQLADALILWGIPYAKDATYDRLFKQAASIVPQCFAFRHMGAIAYDAAMIAAGRADGLFFANLSWWDIAAGKLLIEEAGGVITTFEGTPLTPDYHSCVAGNPLIYPLLRSHFD